MRMDMAPFDFIIDVRSKGRLEGRSGRSSLFYETTGDAGIGTLPLAFPLAVTARLHAKAPADSTRKQEMLWADHRPAPSARVAIDFTRAGASVASGVCLGERQP